MSQKPNVSFPSLNIGKMQLGSCVKLGSSRTSQNGFQLQEGKGGDKNCAEEAGWVMEVREGAKEAEGEEAGRSV